MRQAIFHDRNPKLVQFIQPNVPSARKHDGLADQFSCAHQTHSKSLSHGPSPMALLVRVGPSPASQRRGFVPRSAPGTIDGERSSSFRSRSICVLSLSGWSGSGFSASRNFSPISLAIARRCLWSMSMRRGTTDLRAYPFLASPPASTAAVYKWNRRPPLLAICASACIQNSGPLAATFGYPAICAVSVTASGGLVLPKP